MTAFTALPPASSEKRKPKLIQAYERVIPKWYRDAVPPWWMVGGLCSALVPFANDEGFSTLVSLYWAIIAFCFFTQKVKPVKKLIAKSRLWLAILYAPMLAFYGLPAMAQPAPGGGACSGGGLFAPISQFILTTFANFTIASNGGAIGNVSDFLCGMIAILFLAAIIVFLGGGAWVAGQLFTGTPLTVLVGPISGMLFFVGLIVAVLTLLIGAN